MVDKSAWTRNLGTIVDDWSQARSEAPAIVIDESEEELTYGEFADAIASTGNALSNIGVGRSERIALFFENGAEILTTFFGAMRIGAVPVPINVEAADDTISYVVEDSGAETAVVGPRRGPRNAASTAIRNCDSVTSVAHYGDSVDVPANVELIDLDARIDGADATCRPVDVSFSDPAIQPYSSGSTGRPKGIVLSHGGAYWNAKRFQQVNMMDNHDVTLVVAPLYHKNAMLNTKTTLLGGGTVVIRNGFDSTEVIRTAGEHDVTYLTGVPAIYHLLVQDDEALEQYDVSSVEVGSCGSDTVPKDLYETFEAAFDAPLTEGYGLTEGGPMITMTPRWGPKKRGSAGIPLPEVDARIVDPESDEELSPGEAGELIVASPGVARYHERPEVNEERFEFRDGKRFLRTKDILRRDEQGYHYVVGRLDDLMIVGGENLYPSEVEDRLAAHGAVADVAAVPVPHEIKGEVPVAFVVAKESITEDELRQFALEEGPAYAHPRRIFFRDSLPLTGTDKIDRDRLEERAISEVGTLGCRKN